MPNIFEDIGRSNAADSVNKMTGVAVELSKMNANAEKERVGFAVDLARLNETSTQNVFDREMRRKADVRAEASAKDTAAANEQSIRKAKLETDELEKNTQRLDRWKDPTVNPIFMSRPPEAQKALMDMWKADGALDNEGRVQTRTLEETVHTLSKDTTKFDAILRQPELNKLKSIASEKFDLLEKERAKGSKANPDKIAELTADFNIASKDYSVAEDKWGDVRKKVEDNEKFDQRMKEIKMRGDNAIAVAKKRGEYSAKMQTDMDKSMKAIQVAEASKYKLKTSGALDPATLAMLSQNNPEMAKQMQGGDKDSAIAALDRLIRFHEDKIKALGGAGYLGAPPAAPVTGSEWEDYK